MNVLDQDWPQVWPRDIAGWDMSAWLQRGWWEAQHTAQAWVAGAAWQPCLMVGHGPGTVASSAAPGDAAWSASPAPAGQQPTTPMPLPAWLRVLLAFKQRGRGLGLLAAGLLTANVFALELYTGLGISLNFLYILPLLLFTSMSDHWRSGIFASIGLTLLAVLEYAFNGTLMSLPIASALLARLATYSTIALVWHGLIQTTTRLQEATAALDAERAHAWSLAVTDSLTGLVNRRMFEEQLAAAIAYSRRCGQALSVLLLDVDDFKQINDCFGHAAGDAALREVALALKSGVRVGDVPARIGGDEFAVVLPATDLTQARHIAQRIKERLAPVSLPAPVSEPIAISIGLACLPPPAFRHGAGETATTATIASALLDRADRALYQAKAQKQPAIEIENVVA